MKRFFIRSLIWLGRGTALLLILLILFYAEENWRGARDWAACQKDLAAKGESLDLRVLAPPGKPEDDLSKVPIFAEIIHRPAPEFIGLIPQGTPKPTRMDRIDIRLGAKDSLLLPKFSNFLKKQSIDLAAWQSFYRSLPQAHLPQQPDTPAHDVLQALHQFSPEMNEVMSAVSNPSTYWPLDYDMPFKQNRSGIVSMIKVAQVLPLQAAAHLANGETDLAKRDYLFSFDISRTLEQDNSMVSYLINEGVRNITNAILWEGIHRHAWNTSQLKEMKEALTSSDMLTVAARSERINRAQVLGTIQTLQKSSVFTYIGEPDHIFGVSCFLHVRPHGWWDQDRRAYSVMVQNNIDAIDIAHGYLIRLPENDSPSIFEFVYNPLTRINRSSSENFPKKNRPSRKLPPHGVAGL